MDHAQLPKGYLSMVLHAHLPYVRHPESEKYLEEKWLFEALTETYLPILATLEKLSHDKVPYRLTVSLSPTLMSMWQDELLQQRYIAHFDQLLDLADKELQRTRYDPKFNYLARMYRDKLLLIHDLYHYKYRKDLVAAFRKFQDSGRLELITCGFTHGFLPLLNINPEAVKAQIYLAVEYYRSQFGKNPRGFWLPECGYIQGIDRWLADCGIEYFFVDSHGILFANPRPRYAIFAPIRTAAGVAAFGRDMESSKQVWSANEGYPGDFDYREFYRDIGYDLDFDYIKPHIHPDGIRTDTGFKYYRITGKGDHKEPYEPDWAREKAAIHAGNFVFNRQKQIQHLAAHMDRPPIVIAPYDAELFGHWWFEGPDWLEYVMRKSSYDQKDYILGTPGDYLDNHARLQPSTPATSSWGANGYFDVWLEGSNDWIYRHLQHGAEKIIVLAKKYPQMDAVLRRACNQAARELLLAQSSDLAFIMKTGTMVDYAVRRTKNHMGRFLELVEQIECNAVNEDWLTDLESLNNLYPDLDARIYASN